MRFDIPIDPKTPTPFKDVTGITYGILPVVGDLEYEIMRMSSEYNKAETKDAHTFQNTMINRLVVSWEGEGLPAFPSDKDPARYLGQVTKDRIMSAIMDARELTVEEKKT